MTEHLNTDKYERADKRSGHRNGYRKRNLHTKVGTLELRVPRDREGSFSFETFEKYQRSESEISWSKVFTALINRGIDPGSVEYMVSENHKGMRKASESRSTYPTPFQYLNY